MHLLHGAAGLCGVDRCLLVDEVDVLPCLQVKMLALREVEPGQNCRNDLVDIPINGGLRISSGLWRECHAAICGIRTIWFECHLMRTVLSTRRVPD